MPRSIVIRENSVLLSSGSLAPKMSRHTAGHKTSRAYIICFFMRSLHMYLTGSAVPVPGSAPDFTSPVLRLLWTFTDLAVPLPVVVGTNADDAHRSTRERLDTLDSAACGSDGPPFSPLYAAAASPPGRKAGSDREAKCRLEENPPAIHPYRLPRERFTQVVIISAIIPSSLYQAHLPAAYLKRAGLTRIATFARRGVSPVLFACGCFNGRMIGSPSSGRCAIVPNTPCGSPV